MITRKRENSLVTEDEVRDFAKSVLGFDDNESGVKQGTGQITTFNQLGFLGVVDKPDGWYLPDDVAKPAIILETKSAREDLDNPKWESELFKNLDIAATKYNKVIGILYNSRDVKVYKNKVLQSGLAPDLQHKSYYISLFTTEKLNKDEIYQVTQRINNILHFKFAMTDLQDRMIFTACALVAQRYNPKNGLERLKGMPYNTFKNWIFDALAKAIEDDKKQNVKLDVLLEEYSSVRMAITDDQKAIDDFIDNVCEIADLINSDNWNGEDVMAIFFNEFNRYKGKSDAGQVFTPDHITSFGYRLLSVTMYDRVFDGTCGSGAFLVKSMCNMIKEAGGVNTPKAKQIKAEQLFGIELYPKVFALACANMMIHKDGKTNLEKNPDFDKKITSFSKDFDFWNTSKWYEICNQKSYIFHFHTGDKYGIDVVKLYEYLGYECFINYAKENEILFPFDDSYLIKQCCCTPKQFEYYMRGK